MPFTPTEDPEMAEMIRQNTPWYDAIAVVDPGRPAFYFPKLEEVDEWPLVLCIGMPSVQVHREIARRFALRAMLCFGSDEPDAGLANVRMIMAIAERERRSPPERVSVGGRLRSASPAKSVRSPD